MAKIKTKKNKKQTRAKAKIISKNLDALLDYVDQTGAAYVLTQDGTTYKLYDVNDMDKLDDSKIINTLFPSEEIFVDDEDDLDD